MSTKIVCSVLVIISLIQTDSSAAKVHGRIPDSSQRCPDPVIRLSREEKMKPQICLLHNKKMQLDVVSIVYGLVLSNRDIEEKEFPNAHSVYYGGCIVECYEKAELFYCSKCREAEWRIKTQYRITRLASRYPRVFQLRKRLDTDSSVLSVSFSPGGDTFAAGEEDTIKLYDTKTGLLLRTFSDHSTVINSICFSADGKLLAGACDDATIKIWQVSTGEEIRTITVHSTKETNGIGDYRVLSVKFSPDGQVIGSGSGGFGTSESPLYGEIKLWDVETGKLLSDFPPQKNYVWSVAFSPDGRKLAAGLENAEIVVWDLRTQKPEHKLTGHTGGVISLSFSPDGRNLISGAKDHTVKIWNSQTGKELLTLKEHETSVMSTAVSKRNIIYSADAKGNIIAWNLQSGRIVTVILTRRQGLNSAALSPDENHLVCGYADRKVMIWKRR